MEQMSNSQNSNSNSFELLAPELQKWIFSKGWTTLRKIQEESIKEVLATNNDIIITANTAGGKTEAAFLPILSKVVSDSSRNGAFALCVSPLKALINDQFERISDMAAYGDVKVTKWHGDVAQSHKKKFEASPQGILIITPESLEAMMMRKTFQVKTYFKSLEFVVIDELHTFIGSERGIQLKSLISRIQKLIGKNVRKIGLSATLGDIGVAKEYLSNNCAVVSGSLKKTVKLLLKGFLKNQIQENTNQERESKLFSESLINFIFQNFRGSTNLIFANQRSRVEQLSDLLRRKCVDNSLPNEFYPHHGSLSKALREEVETKLKSGKPLNAFCTNTLELGIDVGDIKAVCQIDPPPNASAFMQRLGRSGRRNDEPSIMHLIALEEKIDNDSNILTHLRTTTVKSIAYVELLIKKWIEPNEANKLHYSTLVQQVISYIYGNGGATAGEMWKSLCSEGAFNNIEIDDFKAVLRSLAESQIIEQPEPNMLMLGKIGEMVADDKDIYSAFTSPEEYKILSPGGFLGTLPINWPLIENSFLIFGGKRWEIISIDNQKFEIYVKPSPAGKVPKFAGGSSAVVHDKVREEMVRIYESDFQPVYIDKQASEFLVDARHYYKYFDLNNQWIFQDGNDIYLLVWAGDKIVNTIFLEFMAGGLKPELWDNCICFDSKIADIETVLAKLREISNCGFKPASELVSMVSNLRYEKFDKYLPEELLKKRYVREFIDVDGAATYLKKNKSFYGKEPPLDVDASRNEVLAKL